MARAHSVGAWGEDLACAFLTACGYRILERGYRIPGGEIDVIVQRGPVVAFVEVKTRGPSALAPPEAWVNARKLGRMRRTARHWLAAGRGGGAVASRFDALRYDVLRFDVVAVRHGGAVGGAEIRHLVDVG